MTKNWYDEGIGSEKLKRDIAKSAYDNPVLPGICVICDIKSKLAVEKKKVKQLRKEIKMKRQWQKCPQCNKTFATDS